MNLRAQGKETLYILAVTPHSLIPQPLPLEALNMLSVSMTMPILDISHKSYIKRFSLHVTPEIFGCI